MTSGLTISSFMPSIVSSGIFSSRRADKGIDALASNNPFVSAMNFDIATGQVANAAKGVANIARESSNSVASGIVSAEEAIKNLSKTDKFLNGVSKVVNFFKICSQHGTMVGNNPCFFIYHKYYCGKIRKTTKYFFVLFY